MKNENSTVKDIVIVSTVRLVLNRIQNFQQSKTLDITVRLIWWLLKKSKSFVHLPFSSKVQHHINEKSNVELLETS